jgi:3-oxoacyl-[acyl-carrier-protein] synthase-3
MRGATIIGTGRYVPEKVLSNHDLEQMVETSDEWIRERTGIRERRIAAPDQAASDLAFQAAQRALAMAGIDATELDHIILATTTPDRLLPSCACTVQQKLGATRAAAYDVFAACTGFVFGLGIANGLVSGGMANRVLVIGVEVLTRITDFKDRNTAVLFGDAAGAAIIQACEPGRGILAVDMHSDGELGDVLEIPAGISRNPASVETVNGRQHFIRMQGKKLFPFAVRSMEDSMRKVMTTAGWSASDLTLCIPHQANLRIIDAVRERLQVPEERMVVNIDRYGNTSSASIPVALDECVRAGRLGPGDKLAMCGFGGGVTWGAVAIEWTRARVTPEPHDATGGTIGAVAAAPAAEGSR